MHDPHFRLIEYLRADLVRQREVARGAPWTGPSWQLAIGALSPRFAPVLLCRLAYWAHLHRLGPIAKIISLINFTLFGLEIAVRCKIGRGLMLPHTQGSVIGGAEIGTNVTIYQGVTIGAKEINFLFREEDRPVILDDVLIEAGAMVLGPITIGRGCRIGGNAVVVVDMPDGALATCTPARILRPSAGPT